MSSEQKLDPSLLEQTKQQIRNLVSEIAQISKSEISPEEFHSEFLPRVITALAATGGAVWTVNSNGQITLGYQVNLQEAHLHDNEEANKKHSRLLYQTLNSEEKCLIVQPHSGGEGADDPGNPTDYLLMLGVIQTGLETTGIVEILQRPESNPATQKGYLRFLQQVTGYANEFYKSLQLRNFGDRQNLWTQLEDFTRNIHKTLDLRETVYTVANESRRLIECDRVSIVISRGRKGRVEAVSGQDMVDKRSAQIKLLNKLATAVIAANEPVIYTGETSNFAPQIENAIEDYVDESHTKMIAVYPLIHKRVDEGERDETEPDKAKPEPPFGAIIIEQIEDNRFSDQMKKRVEIVVEHAETAVGNALDHNSIFLMPLWKLIGKSKILVTAKMLPKTVSVSLGLLLLILAMIFVPWNFNMHCKGTLEPEVRRNIFAREPGKVDEIFVRHGSQVYGPGQNPEEPNGGNGTLLLKLTNNELEADFKKAEGDLAEVQKQIAFCIEAETKTQDPGERLRITGQREQYEVRRKTLEYQRDILQERINDLEIHSPITGTVMTFDLVNKLQSRPVQPGQILMEIAEPDGKLILELDMPEKRMGHIDEYLRKIKSQDPDAKMKVTFVMMVDSTQKFTGTVIEEHDRAENRGEDGTTVQLRASIDNPEKLPDSRRAGAGVSAKIYCGKKPWGYVLFNEAVAYLQKTVFFWFK